MTSKRKMRKEYLKHKSFLSSCKFKERKKLWNHLSKGLSKYDRIKKANVSTKDLTSKRKKIYSLNNAEQDICKTSPKIAYKVFFGQPYKAKD